MYDIGCGGRLIKSWPVYSLVIYPFTKAFGMIQKTERRHHPKSLARPGPAIVENLWELSTSKRGIAAEELLD